MEDIASGIPVRAFVITKRKQGRFIPETAEFEAIITTEIQQAHAVTTDQVGNAVFTVVREVVPGKVGPVVIRIIPYGEFIDISESYLTPTNSMVI